MARIQNALLSVQHAFNSSTAALTTSNDGLVLPNLKRLNDSVYELCKPPGSQLCRPSVEIVFFHGLQFDGSDRAFETTWLSKDGEKSWLPWIVESFREARVLLISYNGSVEKKDGDTDMYVTSENLWQDLIDDNAHVGQDGCPVVLVGHSLGGLVMKEVLLNANSVLNLDPSKKVKENLGFLLQNVKHLFYYSCPHNGTRLADIGGNFLKGQLFEHLSILKKEAARCNDAFRRLRRRCKWKAFSIVEALPTDLDVKGHRVTVSCGEVVGLDDQVETVRAMLHKSRQVGLFGPGGIGKTTLAKLVYNDMADNFEYTCFVSEVKATVPQKASLEDLRREILKNLYYKGRQVNIQWSRLLGKRVLIVLDDVQYESQILVLSESTGFSTESCVILTFRDQQVVRRKPFPVYSVRFLTDEASRTLFCNHAFQKANAPEDYRDLVERFTQKCKGWPLVLEVVGKYLYDQEGSVWDDAYEKLSQAKPLGGRFDENEFWPIFTAIYQSLEPEEQQMFLDIATCFHDEGLVFVNRAWRVWRAFPDAGWKNLLDMGLVTTTITATRMIKIQMHEVLRDLGRSMACPDPTNIQGHSRVCYDIDGSPWPFEQENSKVEILKIVSNGRHHIDTGKLRGLVSLKVLWLDGVTLRGAWSFLPAKLEFLKLKANEPMYESTTSRRFTHDFDDDSVIFILCMCKEVVCELVLPLLEVISRKAKEWYSILRAAFANPHPHPSLRHLETERGLGPSIDTLDQLKVLEYLSFEVCCSRDLPHSFKQHQALKHLRIDNYEDRALPHSLADLQALEHLEIRYSQMDFLPNSLGQFRALKSLTIGGYLGSTVPDSLGKLSALQSLSLRFCKELKVLPSTLGDLSRLKRLTFSYCRKLRVLPSTVGQLLALDSLTLSNCYSLSALPSTIGQLKALRLLEVVWCTRLTALPETIGQLDGLRELRLHECPGLESLPQAMWKLHTLSSLLITQCTSLKALPPRLSELDQLERFEIDWTESYHSLEALVDILVNFEPRQLIRLCVCSREDPRIVKDTLGQLDALKHLTVWIGKNRFDRVGQQELRARKYFEILPDNYPD